MVPPAAALVGLALMAPGAANAAEKGLSFIRDAEIENTIRIYAAPLFEAAGLDASAVTLYLVNDKALNAFVAGGQRLFLNTGLLMRTEHPGQVIGVIAHESGHIAGGHLSRIQGALENSTAQSVLAVVLGGAAAIATGRPDLGQAIALGGQQLGLRSFLHYTRTQEAAADQAALAFLDSTGQSARGLLEFMELLGDQELLSIKRQDPYVRTHPLSRRRIEAIQAHVADSPHTRTPSPERFVVMHARMRAKLYAFLEPYGYTIRRYPAPHNSLAARYAMAIAHYRRPDLDKALPLIDGLIAELPRDPYFRELKGQMLFENGRLEEALEWHQGAVALAPRSGLLRRGLAQVQLELNRPALLDRAIANLRAALAEEHDAPFTWRQLAIAYGRKGNLGMSSLALAEEALLTGDKAAATYQAGRAERLLPEGSPAWLKSQDILQAIDKKE